MSTQLLSTKVHVPALRPERVPRPRLLHRLNDALDQGHRLILVSAPAGFGKTTLLVDWIGQRGSAVAWLSLDEQDDEAIRFWTYLIAALQTVDADLGQDALEMLQTAQSLTGLPVVSSLLNDIAALAQSSPSSDLVLVLDDYHLISTPQVHDGLAFFLEHQPPNLHLVLLTRSDPHLPVFRLRARGQLTEVRSDELRFTVDEATAFLNSMMGLDLSREEVEALETRTEGWIVGLQLAALSLQGRSDVSEFIAAFGGSHHYVLEYLTQEVVRRQTAPVQRFLMLTSILDRLAGPLCDALTSGSDGDATLAELHRRNLFLLPLDDEHRWYRYHPLFADLLGNLLRKDRPTEQIRELHLRASEWYERNDSLDDAVKHALQAHAFERAACLMEQASQALIAHGRLKILLRWLEALPEALLGARPRLRLYQGWALSLSGQIDAADQILLDTKAALQNVPPSAENEALRGQLAALLTGTATLRQETTAVIRQAQDALGHLPEQDRLSRARVHVALGTAYAYEDKPEEATRTWTQARELALAAGSPFLATAAIEMLAGTQIYHQGRLRAAAASLQQVLDLGTTPEGKHLPFTGTSHALLAEVHLEWNELDTATGLLDEGIDLLHKGGIGYGRIHTFCAKARLSRARDDAGGVLQALQEAEQALDAHSMWHMVVHLVACQTRLRLWLGDVGTAERWVQMDPAYVKRKIPGTLPLYLREVWQIAQARVHLAREEPERALATLDGLEDQTRAAGRLAQALEICLLQALAWQAQGKAAAALASLERSLAWAEPEGYLRLFLEAGPDVIPLLQQAALQLDRAQYANRLLVAFGASELAGIPVAKSPDTPALPEALTQRELEVLRLICDGLSNREIAERLTITLNTVKKHGSHIYGKLGVSSRAQAIVRTQELGLC